MHDTTMVWIAILVVTVATLFTRLVGPEIMLRVKLTPARTRFLEALSTSVIAAILAGFLARGSLREAVALGIGALVMVVTRNAMAAMFVCIAAAATWSAFI